VLVADIEQGGFFLSTDVPKAVRNALGKRLRPLPERARENRPLFGSDPWWK